MTDGAMGGKRDGRRPPLSHVRACRVRDVGRGSGCDAGGLVQRPVAQTDRGSCGRAQSAAAAAWEAAKRAAVGDAVLMCVVWSARLRLVA